MPHRPVPQAPETPPANIPPELLRIVEALARQAAEEDYRAAMASLGRRS